VPAGMPTAKLVANVPLAPRVSFPYGFPRADEYRIFVQIKRGGRVETGVFDARGMKSDSSDLTGAHST
jgi:hypothetical protein